MDSGELHDHGRSLFKKFVNRLLMLRNPDDGNGCAMVPEI